MRIDRGKLQELLSKPDSELWGEIVSIAAKHGYTLPEKTPPHEELERLRSLAMEPKINITDAMRLLKQYKKGEKK